MKKLFYILGLAVAAMVTACGNDDDNENVWEAYAEWRETNKTWYAQQADKLDENGDLFYEELSPAWNSGQKILIHWFNDRSETAGNLVPLLRSTVSTIYIGRLYNNEAVDSSYLQPDALFTSRVSALVEGWQIALQNMHVGDSVEIVFPYQLGYGSSSTGNIPPYSALRFNMRLKDIKAYETLP